MGLKLERHLTQLLFLTKKEKKLFAFGGQIIKRRGRNGTYQDKPLRMEPFIKTTHILGKYVKFGTT